MDTILDPREQALLSITKAAGEKALALFNNPDTLNISMKGPQDWLTYADGAVEAFIRQELRALFPHDAILGEEEGGDTGEHLWIIDPIDGTTIFMHGVPHFAVSIGLEREGVMVAGVLFNPVTDDMYYAEKGHGAYLNNKRLRVAERRELAPSLFATGLPFLGREGHARAMAEMTAVMAASSGIRRFGAASLDMAFVAAGRFDGFWERGLNAWDVAAGIVLVREAGGMVGDLHGGTDALNSGTILCANEHLQPQLLKLLKGAAPDKASD